SAPLYLPFMLGDGMEKYRKQDYVRENVHRREPEKYVVYRGRHAMAQPKYQHCPHQRNNVINEFLLFPVKDCDHPAYRAYRQLRQRPRSNVDCVQAGFSPSLTQYKTKDSWPPEHYCQHRKHAYAQQADNGLK